MSVANLITEIQYKTPERRKQNGKSGRHNI